MSVENEKKEEAFADLQAKYIRLELRLDFLKEQVETNAKAWQEALATHMKEEQKAIEDVQLLLANINKQLETLNTQKERLKGGTSVLLAILGGLAWLANFLHSLIADRLGSP